MEPHNNKNNNNYENSKMLLSVVVPTYNKADQIEDLLKSLETQKIGPWINWEILIIDNASAESVTHELNIIIEQFNNLPIRFIQNDINIGMAANWNKCFFEAKGDWVFMVHSDDLVMDGCLNHVLFLIDRIGTIADFIYTGRKSAIYKCNANITELTKTRIYERERVKRYDVKDIRFGIMSNAPTGLLCNRNKFILSGGYEINQHAFALDVDFNIKNLNKFAIYGSTHKCVIKREGDNDTNNSSSDYRISWINSILDIYERNDIFSNKGFLYRMRVYELVHWASISYKDIDLEYHDTLLTKIGIILYRIARIIRKFYSFRRI